MGRHHVVSRSRWGTLLRRIAGRRPAQHAYDPGTQLLPALVPPSNETPAAAEPFDPPTDKLPVYAPEVPSC
ncbi:hypothetical protein IRT45_36040 [Nocardia sp. BSTN01]|uniref:hypothetical protein n=1 Tax=Nocardia sp. BSTN01 TaxID=2783665 RepID=UPI00189088F4|nr:hypothetical protein [Nocardia sp. BSTN01]MBF5002527.1 hypothetical protein [Nocardia sp. BSTN01]